MLGFGKQHAKGIFDIVNDTPPPHAPPLNDDIIVGENIDRNEWCQNPLCGSKRYFKIH